MKRFIQIFLVISMLFSVCGATAQSSAKGFDYKKHQKMNKKAGRWSKHRIKAAGNDHTNIQCSVRKSRKKSRSAKY